MSIIRITFDGEIDMVQRAIDRLKAFEPKDGYYLAYSGGKDSIVIKRLAEMAKVKFEAHYHCTSVDPPELVQFIKKQKDIFFDIPKDKNGKPITMWSLIAKKKMPPTRIVRYCCADLKEAAGKGRLTITGVRWAESLQRKNGRHLVNISVAKKENRIIYNDENDEARRMVESCYRTQKTLINPIIDWTDEEVWQFIKEQKLEYCKLYDEGYKRLGCIGCPMSTHRKEELEKYPKYKKQYLLAFEKMLKNYDVPPRMGKTAQEVYDWWIGEAPQKQIEGQQSINFEEIK
nr:MAG TPA: phosphoadenosine-phosphosulfate reductase [Caudoviricetes sp.]